MASAKDAPRISLEDQPQFSFKDANMEDVLDDLCSRFILNLPDEELQSIERVCFQVEQAHWYYEDFVREENPTLPSYSFKRFSAIFFKACPLLQEWSYNHEDAFNTFMQYKTLVPVCGAIMLNPEMTKCVLVKGWKASSGWGFPKGKINETEPPHVCAVREVLEETGYNLAGKINPEHVLETNIKGQQISLYIVAGVPEDFPFQTKTRKEISKIEWFSLTELPTWKKHKMVPGKFYLISPFITPLRNFVANAKPLSQPKSQNEPKKKPKAKKAEKSIQQAVTRPVQDQAQVQASSSQSSTDPNDVSKPGKGSSADGIVAAPLDTAQGLDPHFARLLTSLTLSAAATETNAKPANGTAASAIQPDVYSSDTSFSSPTISKQNVAVPRAGRGQRRSSDTLTTTQTSVAPVSDVPLGSPPSIHSTQPPVMRSPLASHKPHTIPTSPRRSSTATDLSPYLTKLPEVPTSAKALQQLSLLESVANESARMAPIIAARAAQPLPQPLPHTGYPPLPPSHLVHANVVQDPRPLTAFDPAAFQTSGYPLGFNSMYPVHPPPPNIPMQHSDPYHIRSHTSQAFHRPPLHNPTGSVSFGYGQPFMNGARPPLEPPHLPPGRIGPPNINPATLPNLTFHDPRQLPGSSMMPPPPMSYPPAFNNFSGVGPSPSARLSPNPPANPTSAALLSILNGSTKVGSFSPAHIRR